MKKGKSILGVLIVCILLGVIYFEHDKLNQYIYMQKGTDEETQELPVFHDKVDYYYQTKGDYFNRYTGTKFEPVFIKGVNLGMAKPGHFPGEAAITKAEYKRWIQQIGEMNANTIRVYTLQPPEFYEALYEYNKVHDEKLYLFQGVWFDEGIIFDKYDVYDAAFQKILHKDIEQMVDVLHGNCNVAKKRGHASGNYQYDVSPYVMGWILGIEPEAELIQTSNKLHPEKKSYSGTYLYANEVSPFEAFWAETGDYTISYEMERYHLQRPLSFVNWPTADILEHKSETMIGEDAVSITMEALHATEQFKAGLFASYHIYPYYPNFMYTQQEYKNFVDTDGKKNTYKAYLLDMKKHHTMPVLVAEFGVPESKGIAHRNMVTGFSQGNIDEFEQGKMETEMLGDMLDTGCAGGLIFSWQDEWFKKTWNTTEYTDVERRAYWCDEMTNEQHFGLLDFVPGIYQETVVLDGNPSEWDEDDLLISMENEKLYVKQDAAYLYFMIDKQGADFEKEKELLPIAITPFSGAYSYQQYQFNKRVDFLVELQGKEDSTILVQEYYDRYLFEYSDLEDKVSKDKVTETEKYIPEKDSTNFEPVYLFLERQLKLPDTGEIVPMQKFDVSHMVFGTNDYDSEAYNSIADFYYCDDILEMRIPWGMLNFRDPSSREIEDDFYKNNEFRGTHIKDIYIGMADGSQKINLVPYSWKNWDERPYFERLKKSYYILQEALKEIDIKKR